MNAHFSDASRLLIESWDIVREIHESEATLAAELRDYLYSLQRELEALPWWDDQWVFLRYKESQVYIARSEWWAAEEYAIWIGLEEFTPEALFGAESSASLYIWVAGYAATLVAPLREILARRDDLPGDLSAKANRYVVKSGLRKCLPDEIDAFDDVYHDQIVGFFDYFGRLHADFTAVLRQTLPE